MKSKKKNSKRSHFQNTYRQNAMTYKHFGNEFNENKDSFLQSLLKVLLLKRISIK